MTAAAFLVIQNNQRLAKEARKRRMEHKGHDQVFIKFRDSKKKVGDKVEKELNELLGFDPDGPVDYLVKDHTKEERNCIWRSLRKHRHLKDGTVVEEVNSLSD